MRQKSGGPPPENWRPPPLKSGGVCVKFGGWKKILLAFGVCMVSIGYVLWLIRLNCLKLAEKYVQTGGFWPSLVESCA